MTSQKDGRQVAWLSSGRRRGGGHRNSVRDPEKLGNIGQKKKNRNKIQTRLSRAHPHYADDVKKKRSSPSTEDRRRTHLARREKSQKKTKKKRNKKRKKRAKKKRTPDTSEPDVFSPSLRRRLFLYRSPSLPGFYLVFKLNFIPTWLFFTDSSSDLMRLS